jgi:hypothetical protein
MKGDMKRKVTTLALPMKTTGNPSCKTREERLGLQDPRTRTWEVRKYERI